MMPQRFDADGSSPIPSTSAACLGATAAVRVGPTKSQNVTIELVQVLHVFDEEGDMTELRR
jgi:hypothetical protein